MRWCKSTRALQKLDRPRRREDRVDLVRAGDGAKDGQAKGPDAAAAGSRAGAGALGGAEERNLADLGADEGLDRGVEQAEGIENAVEAPDGAGFLVHGSIVRRVWE